MEFREEQKFNQPWLIIILILSGMVTIGVFGVGFYRQILLGKPYGNQPMNNEALIISFIAVIIFFISIFVLFNVCKLVVNIDRFGIEFRFIPFQRKTRKIEWKLIESFEVRKYKPILEYGGWGIRYGLNGKAYNVKGNMGLQLKLKDGKKILLGTQKPDELKEFLLKMNTKTES
jgi:hypothetical protein